MNHTPTIIRFLANVKISIIAACLIAFVGLAFTLNARAASGDVDPTFNAATYNLSGGGVSVVTAQPDGKLLVGGTLRVVNGVARHGIARLNSNGSLDTSFDPPDFYDQTNGLGSLITSIVLQTDGKILVGGRFTIFNSTYRSLVRLNQDGTIDGTFQNYFGNSPNFTVGEVAVLPDDSLLILGELGSYVYKLDANGFGITPYSYQNTGGFLKDLASLPDGRFYVSDTGIERHNINGSLDPTFPTPGSNGTITEAVVQPDGKILVAGTFTSLSGFTYGRLARLNSDASVDLTFNTNGIGANGTINDIRLASNGDIYIGGDFTQYNGTTKNKLAKLTSNGILDPSFTYSPPVSGTSIKDIEMLPNGKIAIAGTSLGTTAVPVAVVVLNADGSADLTFAASITTQSLVREVIQQLDGKVVIVGSFPLANGVARNSMARLNADGTLDTGFVPYFNGLTINQSINAVAQQTDGKLLVGSSQGIILRRLNSDGTQDTSFTFSLQSSSLIYDVVVQSDGKILIGGNFGYLGDTSTNPRRIGRLNADGTVDAAFTLPIASQPNATIYRVLAQSDGKLLIAGDFTQISSAIRGRIARLNSDGSLDATFNPPAGANGSVFALDRQADGKVLVGGAFTQLNGSNSQIRLGRLNSDGSLDASFAPTANNNVNSIKVQPDGKILVGGIFSSIGATARASIARLNANGSIDNSFAPAATSTVVNINLQSDGKILIGGDFTEINNISRITVARLLNAMTPARTPFDYDGDGKSDVSVFRASENNWYILRSSDFGVTQTAFAIAGDVPVPADFDGDGKTDVAIFRPSNGNWWSLSSINGQQINFPFGTAGDIPLPSDFDGDGRSDYVVFRPSTNQWLRASSANGAQSNKAFGLAGDKPVIGDFDGDGKSDVAVYRPSDGNWWWWSSFDNVQRATRWGIATDIPAPADYDGDGKTDFAVFRPSTGVWYIYNSATATPLIGPFGLTGDKPVPADFDGDGKADIAVYRPSDGIWYLLRTTSGFTGFRFGIATDTPTQNAFLQ